MFNWALSLFSTNVQTIGITPEERAALTRPWEQLTETQKKLIANLEADLSLSRWQVQRALEIFGEVHVAPEHLGAKLIEFAEQFKVLLAHAIAKPGDTPRIAALKSGARAAIEAVDLARADALFAEVQLERRKAREHQALEDAEISAQRGAVALARFRYSEAAQHFADAASMVPEGCHEEHWTYLIQEANSLYNQGDEYGDNDALIEAIDIYRRCLAVIPRSERPLD
jgi:hypothetical protein